MLGYDPDPHAMHYARDHALIDGTVDGAAEALEHAGTFVVAAPLAATLEILEECAAAPHGSAQLIVDVASVKRPLVPFLGRVRDFVPTHPLAGAETAGLGGSRADLFVDRPWAFVASGDPTADEHARAFITTMGAYPVELDAETHDRVVALTSHVPQLLSTVLAARLSFRGEPEVTQLYGPGLESMLRLARSPWPMWSGILRANAPAVAAELRELAAALTSAAETMESGDAAALETFFKQANAFMERLHSKS